MSTTKHHAGRGALRVWLTVGVVSAVALLAAAAVKRQASHTTPGAERSRAAKVYAVRVASAERGSIPLQAEYRGELVADVAELAAQGSGRLLAVEVNLGDHFKKGDVLARVDAAEARRLLGEARAQEQSALASKERTTAQWEAARVEAERGAKLLAENLISDQELFALRSQVKVYAAEISAADAQRAAANARVALYQEQLSQTSLKAPFDGAVAERYLDAGATVQPGTPVLRLVHDGPLEVRFRASEVHVGRLQVATPLQLRTLATGARVFEGALSRISAEVSRSDRSIAAEGTLAAEHAELRPGMYATVGVTLGRLEDAVLIPREAIVSRIERDGATRLGVFVVEGQRAKERSVELLGQFEGRAAVQGLESGETVVTLGQESLSDGATIAIAPGEDKQP